jgi:hypothetical protein
MTSAARWADHVTRLIVLPFRMLRPDADTEFLAFSLPDAVAELARRPSLAGGALDIVAARFTGDGLEP